MNRVPGWMTRGTRAMALGVIGCVAVACVGTSGETSTAADDGPTGGDGVSEASDHEPQSECVEEPACDPEALCEVVTCGGKTASINHFGCERPSCGSDTDCPANEACYPRAMGAICLSSSVDCQPTAQGCECGSTDDCNGVLDAHCLPAEFYPVPEYCDTSVFECADFGPWHDTLRFTLINHAQAGRTELADRLGSCSATVVDARLACGETACAVACQLSSCPGTDIASCEQACAASALDVTAIEDMAAALAVLPEPTCACDRCEGDAACEATWGC